MSKPRKLVDLDVYAVAGVDKAANRRRFLVVKQAQEGGESMPVPNEREDVAKDKDRSLLKAAWELIAKHLGMHEAKEGGEEQMVEQVAELDELLKNASDDLKESVKAAFAKQEERLAELQKRVDELSKESETEAEAESDEINKADLPEPVRKRLEDLEKKAQEAERVAKAERDARVRAEIRKRAESYANAGPVDDLTELIYKAHEVSAEYGQKIEETLRTAHERIAKGDLFREFGSGGDYSPVSDDPAAQFADLVEKRSVAEGVSFEEAARKVAKERPELVQEYQKSAPLARS